MPKKPDASRGIEEVSRYFLSGVRRENIPGKSMSNAKTYTLSICHLNSSIRQAFFIANIALELSRHRHKTYVWDCKDQPDIGTRHMMSGLPVSKEGNSEYIVQLYGLPDIRIYTPGQGQKVLMKTLVDTCNASNRDCFVLVNDDETLESTHNIGAHPGYILITQIHRISLIKCYAYIKSILGIHEKTNIFIVFDEVREEGLAHKTFVKLSRFVDRKLSFPLVYLGCFKQDDHMTQCIEDRSPVVTSNDSSTAKGKFVFIVKRFLDITKTNTEADDEQMAR